MSWSIDSCQKRVSTAQCHMTVSQAQVYNSLRWHVFLKLSSDQLLVSNDRRLNYFRCFLVIGLKGQVVNNLLTLLFRHYKEISDLSLDVLTSRFHGQHIKALVCDFPVMTSLLVKKWYTVYIAHIFYTIIICNEAYCNIMQVTDLQSSIWKISQNVPHGILNWP